jgi:small subunit ribosomal protein S8
MRVTDPIADFLTRIRNALAAQHRYVDVNWSKIKENVAAILKQLGFIESYVVKREGGIATMRLFLKYVEARKPVIQGLTRVSKPGLRKYVGYEDIPKFYGGQGVAILSTSSGVLSGNEAAKRKIGGELLCLVW